MPRSIDSFVSCRSIRPVCSVPGVGVRRGPTMGTAVPSTNRSHAGRHRGPPARGATMAKGIPLPDGYHSVNPYIVSTSGERLLAFLVEAFGGVEHERLDAKGGGVGHAEVRIGDSLVMLTDGADGTPPRVCSQYLYVDDVDRTFAAAVAAGGTPLIEPADQFYGDRLGGVVDPTGNTWYIATHLEDVAPDQLRARAAARS